MRAWGAIALAAVLGGCSTTRVVQRDGCWVRETKRTLLGKTEELGPCMRPQPKWAEDRLTRLVQECMAEADHRWTVRAIEAWSRKEPLPAQEPEKDVARACMNEAASGAITQNETLRERLAEVTSDRTALAARTAETDAHLRASHDRLAEFLGEAAKRPPPVATATATATSDGTATTDTGLTSETGTSSQAVPAAAPVVHTAAAPPAAPAPAAQAGDHDTTPAVKAIQRARAARKARARKASAPGCDPSAPAAAAAAAKPAPAAGEAPAGAAPPAPQAR
jgi:hypothetical protein